MEDAAEAVRAAGRVPLWFYGPVAPQDREAAYHAFRDGAGDLIATIASGLSRGRDLSRADTIIYYSNEWSLRLRGQSEDRAEGLDRTRSTGIVDLVAADTRDLDVIEALRAKKSLAELVMGDEPTRWI